MFEDGELTEPRFNIVRNADGTLNFADLLLIHWPTIPPFRIEATIPAKSLAYFVDGVHWLDALTPPLEAHIGALVATMRRLLSEPRQSSKGELHPPAPTRAADP